MNETKRTITYCAVAAVLVVLALVSAPKKITPHAFLEQGEAFFPGFEDPNTARTLEVIDFDEENGVATPFKVTFRNGRWSIPSHHDYPADGKDRLAKTAAGVMGIKKDDFRSDNASDHELCSVVDPLDDTAVSLKGRGQRITIKGENDVVLADFIVGKEVEGRENVRFVRVPEQKRVYSARMDLDLSTQFKDWIEADLLSVKKDDLEQVVLKDYSINERTGRVNNRDVVTVTKQETDWIPDRLGAKQETNKTKMNQLLAALEKLTIEGVRPKPAGLSTTLTQASDSLQIKRADLMSLQSKGYFFSSDGRLLSNEGELQLRNNKGVVYTLRFGEIAYGSGVTISAGTGADQQGGDGPAENRYLFITTEFDASQFPEPEKPANTEYLTKADSLWTEADHKSKALMETYQRWSEKVTEGRSISDELNARFAKWYYVISSKSFDELHLTRNDLVQDKKS